MPTKQTDTMALTDAQLETIAGRGNDINLVWHGFRSVEPKPSPSPISFRPLPSFLRFRRPASRMYW